MNPRRTRQEQIEHSIRTIKSILKSVDEAHTEVFHEFGLGDVQFDIAYASLGALIIILQNEYNVLNNATWSEPAREDD